jgi:hypothetical protein
MGRLAVEIQRVHGAKSEPEELTLYGPRSHGARLQSRRRPSGAVIFAARIAMEGPAGRRVAPKRSGRPDDRPSPSSSNKSYGRITSARVTIAV